MCAALPLLDGSGRRAQAAEDPGAGVRRGAPSGLHLAGSRRPVTAAPRFGPRGISGAMVPTTACRSRRGEPSRGAPRPRPLRAAPDASPTAEAIARGAATPIAAGA
jgi:hypothetical protein